MRHYRTIAIVGVGLIGGSIGLAIRQRKLADEVVGIGRRSSSLRKARQCGAADRTTTNIARGVAAAELVIVSTPIESIVAQSCAVAAVCPPGTLITDVGSTKQEIVAALDGLGRSHAKTSTGPVRFLGGHPLSGDHRMGPEYARADLFEKRTVVLTPTRRSRHEDVHMLDQLWSQLGAKVLTMSARQHDWLIASTSHVPHATASALAAATPEASFSLVATGWMDTTRVAAGDPRLWRQILLTNQKNVLQGLLRLEKNLASLRNAIQQGDGKRLEQLLKKAKSIRDAVGS